MDVEKLIEGAKKRPILYESTKKAYKDAARRDDAWKEVAEELAEAVAQPGIYAGGAHVSLPSPPLRSRPQIQLGGMGERCKLPQRGLGRSPSRNRLWCIFSLKIRHLVATILRIFVRVN